MRKSPLIGLILLVLALAGGVAVTTIFHKSAADVRAVARDGGFVVGPLDRPPGLVCGGNSCKSD